MKKECFSFYCFCSLFHGTGGFAAIRRCTIFGCDRDESASPWHEAQFLVKELDARKTVR